MRTHTRIAPFTMTAVLLAGGVAASTAGPAGAAAPTAKPTVKAACLDTAKNYTITPGSAGRNAHWPRTGSYAYTTANCQDINLKVSQTRDVKACFKATQR
ncbi:hypothetical protein ACIBBB_00500 [Streptomyces sp. NPDC051217]|uniref:hypothetical protein n=1 Tax=Streptomyces sp. NPDC051217 TaxID=3365644 RepID=UPI00378F53DC